MPILLHALEDRMTESAAATSLAELGRAAVPGLVELIERQKLGVSFRVFDVLSQIGAEGVGAVPVLIELLADEQHALRYAS